MKERILKINEVKQNFILIPAGKFYMGSPNNEPQRKSSEFQHKVTLTKDFWIADTACTQALWEAVMGTNPAKIGHCKSRLHLYDLHDIQLHQYQD